jgi:predicted nuclease of predicted toxin-antitoxin system
MRILIDESLPKHLEKMLLNHETDTVQGLGWAGIKNGDLISKAEAIYDVFLTADKNLRYQQNMTGRILALLIFPTNKLSVVKQLANELEAALTRIKSGEFIELEMPNKSEAPD